MRQSTVKNKKRGPRSAISPFRGHGRFAAVIPVYNHEEMVAQVVRRALALRIPVIVVDDGSTDGSYEQIKDIKGIIVLRHKTNRGKGAALLSGFAEAARHADWVLTIDADGQHDPADGLTLARAIPAGSRPIVVGARKGMLSPDVPWTSRFGRGFSNFWVRASGGPKITDSQSGLRLYPLPETLSLPVRARRFQFEVEVLVRARWRGIPVIEAPVSVSYTPGGERISHFRPFVDFMRNSSAFTRLIATRIFVPRVFRSRG